MPKEVFLRCNKNSSWTHIWNQSEGRKFVLFFWNAVVLGEYLVYDTKSNAIKKGEIGILLPKLIVQTYCEKKKFSSDQEKLLKFEAEAEGREFSKILRSLEQFTQTVKGQNNFWLQNAFLTCSWKFLISN